MPGGPTNLVRQLGACCCDGLSGLVHFWCNQVQHADSVGKFKIRCRLALLALTANRRAILTPLGG